MHYQITPNRKFKKKKKNNKVHLEQSSVLFEDF